MLVILVILPKVGFSPIAQLLIAGIGVVRDDALFGYERVGLLLIWLSLLMSKC